MKKSAQNNRIKQIQFSKPFANKNYIFYTYILHILLNVSGILVLYFYLF